MKNDNQNQLGDSVKIPVVAMIPCEEEVDK